MKKPPYICPTCGVNHSSVAALAKTLLTAVQAHEIRIKVAEAAMTEITNLIHKKSTASLVTNNRVIE